VQRMVKFKLNDVVRSHYRAAWTGYVVERVRRHEPCGWCKDLYSYVVMVTHDRRGNPVRKPFRSMLLDACWLQAVAPVAPSTAT
jgi:hypothetical protein